MADAPDKDQKTEDPTPKKLEDARKKGEIASAPEVRHAVMFVAALVVLGGLGTYTMQSLGRMFVRLWGNAEDYPIDPDGAEGFVTGVFLHFATAMLPVMTALFAFALLGGLLQGRPMIAWTRMKPKFSKLNPWTGLKRQFSKQSLVEFLKTLAKLMLVGGVAAWVAWPNVKGIDQLVGADAGAVGGAALHIVQAMLKPVVLLASALALFDILWQRYTFNQKMRMSLQEVKDEHKNAEGDPKIKGKIRQIQMQRSRSRMMQAVPEASVVITNPTHYAVALKYDHGSMAAPVVVAKGMDAIALKIRAIATEHNIPIVENVPLARALHAACDVDRPIPTEHYAAVAEVISYILRIARQRRGG